MKIGISNKLVILQSTHSLNRNIFKDLFLLPAEMHIPQHTGAKTARMKRLAPISRQKAVTIKGSIPKIYRYFLMADGIR
jgi:hypothetical protein